MKVENIIFGNLIENEDYARKVYPYLTSEYFTDKVDRTVFDLIKEYGWYSVGGKCKKPVNKTGCSRDHKVSITEAVLNQYDPYYINRIPTDRTSVV